MLCHEEGFDCKLESSLTGYSPRMQSSLSRRVSLSYIAILECVKKHLIKYKRTARGTRLEVTERVGDAMPTPCSTRGAGLHQYRQRASLTNLVFDEKG